MYKSGISRFSVGNFLSHSTEKLRRGRTLLCLKKTLASKVFMHKRGRRITILRRFFLPHTNEKFRRGTFLCCISENFLYRRNISCIRRYHYFPSKCFCLTAPKRFVEEPFSVLFQKNSGIYIFLHKRGVS